MNAKATIAFLAFAPLGCAINRTNSETNNRIEELRLKIEEGYLLAHGADEPLAQFSRQFVLPEADLWLNETFGVEAGRRVAAKYSDESAKLPELVAAQFRKLAHGSGLTIKIQVVETENDTTRVDLRAVQRSMKRLEPVYLVQANTLEGWELNLCVVHDSSGFHRIDCLLEAAPEIERCAITLQELGNTMLLFRELHGRFPFSLDDLRDGSIAVQGTYLRCISHPNDEIGYCFFYPFEEDQTTGSFIVAWDCVEHDEAKLNALHFNGSVMSYSRKELDDLLQLQKFAAITGLSVAIREIGKWGQNSEGDSLRAKRLSELVELSKTCGKSK